MPQKYVTDEVVPCIVDTLILSKGLKGTITMEECERDIRSMNIDLGNVQVRERVENLERTGHLKHEGSGYVLTEDGRMDITKAMPWFQKLIQKIGTITPTMGSR